MFYIPTRIFFAGNALQQAREHIARLGTKALIICGRHSATRSGVMNELLPLLEELQQSYEVFAEIPENPDLETVIRGKQLMLEGGFDFVIGIGGGSPLDASKAIMLATANDLKEDQLYDTGLMRKRLPLMAIPTTHGTGSEVTPYSVLTDPTRKKKAGFGTDLAFPDLAILDPRYTLSLTPRVTLNTSIDALSHLLEGIYSTRRNPHLYPMIAEGMRLIVKNLKTALNEPEHLPTRANLMKASMFGGIAIAHSSTTLQHSIGYPFTTEFGIPHGLANGIFMRQMMDFYYPAVEEELANVFAAVGITRDQFYDWLSSFPIDVRVPISDAMIDEKIPEIMAARNTVISPVKPTPDQLRALLKSVQQEKI